MYRTILLAAALQHWDRYSAHALAAREVAGAMAIGATHSLHVLSVYDYNFKAPASGLPAGTPPQLVIAKAILVTTKGGRSTIDIHFSKTVAARLSHAHSAPLMLRLIVRRKQMS